MHSSLPTTEVVRRHAENLLGSIGVSRIVVVDDEYSGARPEVEELLGICTSLPPDQAAALPYLDDIDFDADRDIWSSLARKVWQELGATERREVLDEARAREMARAREEEEPEGENAVPGEDDVLPSRKDDVEDEADGPAPDTAAIPRMSEPADQVVPVDTRAARSLEDILSGLEKCAFLTLSLKEWKESADELLADELASTTVFLFDRDFAREEDGAENEGFNLVRDLHSAHQRRDNSRIS